MDGREKRNEMSGEMRVEVMEEIKEKAGSKKERIAKCQGVQGRGKGRRGGGKTGSEGDEGAVW